MKAHADTVSSGGGAGALASVEMVRRNLTAGDGRECTGRNWPPGWRARDSGKWKRLNVQSQQVNGAQLRKVDTLLLENRRRWSPRRAWGSSTKSPQKWCRRRSAKRRLHRDESPAPQSRRRAVLQQARDRRAMDQGRQAGGALDAPVVSSVPGERGPVAAERARVQLGESVAAARPTDADRHVVADQPPATPRQDGWAAGQARPVLLVDVGRESSDAAAVWVVLQRIWALPVPTGSRGSALWTVWGVERTKGGRGVCTNVGASCRPP